MDTHARRQVPPPATSTAAGTVATARWRDRLVGGGTEGNERLTVLTGVLLILLLAVLGVTIVRIGQFLWLHLFLGLALIGPVVLKLISTGYRFMRYYTADAPYRRKGPPAPALRILGPVLVGLTAIVFATGVALLLIGPGSASRGPLLLLHKVSFIGWLVVTAVHIGGHLPEILRFDRVSRQARMEINELRSRIPGFGGRADPPVAEPVPGGRGRWLSMVAVMAVGVVLAVALIPQFGAWTSPTAQALVHDHHDR